MATMAFELLFWFKLKFGSVLQCWKAECKKKIQTGDKAYVFRKNGSGLRSGFIWCEECTTKAIGPITNRKLE